MFYVFLELSEIQIRKLVGESNNYKMKEICI